MHYLIKDAKDINLLLENKVPEGVTLDFKQKLPDLGDSKQKREFLKDITSFANTQGGQILFGIEEEKAVPKTVCGVSVSDQDSLKLQLLNIIRTGIEPRVSGVTMDLISYQDNITLINVKIPASWNAPHWVSLDGHHKFYGRTGVGNYELSHSEIRDKFIMTSTVKEKIKSFRDKRVSDLLQKKSPVVLRHDGPQILLHIVPLSAFASNFECDVLEMEDLFRKQIPMFFPLGSSGIDKEITLEGLLTTPGRQDSHRAYTHFYRQGIVEALATVSFGEEGEEKIIPSTAYERHLIVQKYLDILRRLNFVPPFYVFLSLINIKGYSLRIFPGGGYLGQETARKPYIENEILLREVVVESFEVPQDKLFKPLFDQFCNAWGFVMCPHYNSDGTYKLD